MANIPEIDPNDRLLDYENVPRGGRPRWRRRILTGLIAVAVLGGFAVVVVASLDRGADKGVQTAAPVVKAMDGPTKVKPAEPGGMKIPDQDKQVFTRLDPNAANKSVERLLPPPKRVLDSPPAPAKPAAELELSPAQAPAPPPVPKPPPAVAAAPPTAPAVTEKAAEKPVEKPARQPAAQQQAAKEAATAAAAARVAPAAGGYRVQLAALRSEQAAHKAWGGFAKQHADLFGKLTPTVVKAEIKGRGTFYRLQAGPLADDAAARALCAKLKRRKIGCLVVKP